MTSLRAAIKRLSIKPGDVIIVRDWDLTNRIAGIDIRPLRGTPIIEVKSFDDVRLLSEKMMNRLGWYRKSD